VFPAHARRTEAGWRFAETVKHPAAGKTPSAEVPSEPTLTPSTGRFTRPMTRPTTTRIDIWSPKDLAARNYE
jgi:hypothetical protein